ncbi:transketolase family protein [bacterium]|nr:transketolase family protein [bacterium]
MSDVATRDAYGKKLAELGEKYANIVVLDADLSGSTKTGVFAKKFPERFFNMGVAEQDLMGTAAGLASTGKVAYASTFAVFAAGRAWEIIRQSACYPNFNVKVCASHAGLSVGEDGASHQMIEDIAIMRAIPNMKVFVPCDGAETEQVIEAVYHLEGPCYVRLGRAKCPSVFPADYKFQVGKGFVIKEGSDVCLFTAGFLTGDTLGAAAKLAENGISASVVALASVKPIDEELISKMAKKHRLLVSVEEHTVVGGIGSAIAEVLTSRSPAPLLRLGMQDEFGQSADAKILIKHYGLDAEGIAQSVLKRLKEV